MIASRLSYVIAFTTLVGVGTVAPAKADDYGCQVLLCLSNPAGAMAVAQCVPPITKLYEDLAKGRPFPTCTGGGGVETSAPVYDPYFCSPSFVLAQDRGQSYCISPTRTQTVDCPAEGDETTANLPFGGPVRTVENGGAVCKDYQYSTVQRYEKPRYLDVTVTATGKQVRIRY
jgi:hypothetical protein